MAFFTFILYKSECLQIATILVVIDVAMKFLLLLQILRKLADHKRSLFTFILLLNLLFLRHLWAFFFLTQSFHIARKSLVTVLRFLRNLRTSRSSSWPSLSLVGVEFCKICYSCYFCHICYSIFSHSKINSSYFCDFCDICYFFYTFLIAVFFKSFSLTLRKQ